MCCPREEGQGTAAGFPPLNCGGLGLFEPPPACPRSSPDSGEALRRGIKRLARFPPKRPLTHKTWRPALAPSAAEAAEGRRAATASGGWSARWPAYTGGRRPSWRCCAAATERPLCLSMHSHKIAGMPAQSSIDASRPFMHACIHCCFCQPVRAGVHAALPPTVQGACARAVAKQLQPTQGRSDQRFVAKRAERPHLGCRCRACAHFGDTTSTRSIFWPWCREPEGLGGANAGAPGCPGARRPRADPPGCEPADAVYRHASPATCSRLSLRDFTPLCCRRAWRPPTAAGAA